MIAGDFLLEPVDGLDSLVMFGAELGKWLGKVRLHVTAGGGASVCSPSVCAPMKDSKGKETDSQTYYVPLLGGAEMVLAQLGPMALDMRAQYRVGITAADTFAGQRKSFLHGPLLTPAITFTLPDPIAPGIPGGTRRGLGLSLQAPLGYVMSARGGGSVSVGFGLVIMFPIH